MERSIFTLDKFWVIWVSCLDRPRTISEIQKLWGYEGNALYQKGLEEPIWIEMIKEKYLQSKGKVKIRGVSGELLYGNFDWVMDYLTTNFSKMKLHREYSLPHQLIDCIENKKKFLYFLDTNREIFFLPQRLKTLFGNKEILKNNYELCITAPMLIIFDYFIITTLKKKLNLGEDTIFLLSHSLVFTPNLSINFFDYYKEVMKELSLKEMPLGIINQTKIFKLWRDYAHKMIHSIYNNYDRFER